MTDLRCPYCKNYPDTPNHELGCPGPEPVILIEDEDGAPYPEVWAVWVPDAGLHIPYPGSRGVASFDAAWAVVNPNRHLGYKVVRCQLVPVKEDKRPCAGKNSNVCVGEGCYGEACLND